MTSFLTEKNGSREERKENVLKKALEKKIFNLDYSSIHSFIYSFIFTEQLLCQEQTKITAFMEFTLY